MPCSARLSLSIPTLSSPFLCLSVSLSLYNSIFLSVSVCLSLSVSHSVSRQGIILCSSIGHYNSEYSIDSSCKNFESVRCEYCCNIITATTRKLTIIKQYEKIYITNTIQVLAIQHCCIAPERHTIGPWSNRVSVWQFTVRPFACLYVCMSVCLSICLCDCLSGRPLNVCAFILVNVLSFCLLICQYLSILKGCYRRIRSRIHQSVHLFCIMDPEQTPRITLMWAASVRKDNESIACIVDVMRCDIILGHVIYRRHLKLYF